MSGAQCHISSVKHTLQNVVVVLLCLIIILYNYAMFCGWKYNSSFRIVLVADPQIEGLAKAESEGHNVSNYYNDFYQRHIISSLVYFLRPSYMVVLGDIFSSQTLIDSDFHWRVSRFKWIFDSVYSAGIPLINVTGNHDIGYGNEISRVVLNRWQSIFGAVNFNIILCDHSFVILNSMILDNSKDQQLHTEAWEHIRRSSSLKNVIILTHIPLHKDPSPCIDKPFVAYDRFVSA